MAEEQNTSEEVAVAQEGDAGQVTLSRGDYDSLITEMTEYKLKAEQALSNQQREAAKRDLERSQQRPQQQQPQQRVDFDAMSKVDFANFIMSQVNQHMIQPVLELVMTNVVKDEIREASGKHEDFWVYKDEVYKLTTDNPQLSIEKAYKLAKAENPDKGKPKEDPKPRVMPIGEKPSGPGRGVVTPQVKMSVRAAAMKAMDDYMKDLPEEK